MSPDVVPGRRRIPVPDELRQPPADVSRYVIVSDGDGRLSSISNTQTSFVRASTPVTGATAPNLANTPPNGDMLYTMENVASPSSIRHCTLQLVSSQPFIRRSLTIPHYLVYIAFNAYFDFASFTGRGFTPTEPELTYSMVAINAPFPFGSTDGPSLMTGFPYFKFRSVEDFHPSSTAPIPIRPVNFFTHRQ